VVAIERETLEVDVLFVGAGPASLAGAIRLAALGKRAGRELSILVVEKAGALGNHSLSGAILDPRGLEELLVDIGAAEPPPLDAVVTDEALWYLTERGKLKAPWLPPALTHRGNHLVSLNRLVAWLGERAAEAGVDVFPGFPAVALLWEGERVVGARIGDKGLGADGAPRSNFEPGPEVRAKITILGEGVRGTLAKIAIRRLGLAAGAQPASYSLGIKELWKLPVGRFPAGRVLHTLGAPLPTETFGGGWLFGLNDDVLDIGFVVGLDAPDPSTDAHDAFNRFKLHPEIRPLLEGGTLLAYGAKAIPEGGLLAMPRLYSDGLLLIGDTAGMLDSLRLKGIHLAMKSGLLAAEATFAALERECYDAKSLAAYEERFRASWAYEELYRARNTHQGFEHGLFGGLVNAALGMASGGRGFGLREELPATSARLRLRKITDASPKAERVRVVPDGVVTFDKLSDVYRSGTRHDEAQPSHLHVLDTSICADRCTREYGNPCRRFCPAQVYLPDFVEKEGKIEGSLRVDFANCVHCKTCDIADPYQIIDWVPPQGGDGPVYTGM
jgi:electron-transferring-flavoprotein dehydrogenase